MITRQSINLFSKHSHGVKDACEAVGLFCTLGNYWEKFGINRDMLPKMPQKEYLMLKMMVGNEGEAMRRNNASAHSKPSPNRVAGAGGRTRASRGVVVG